MDEFNFPLNSDEYPVSRDCAETYNTGRSLPGLYLIDPSGQGKSSLGVEVYCEDGWTYILKRGQHNNAKVVIHSSRTVYTLTPAAL